MLLMANSTKQILGLPAYKIKHTMVLRRAANKEHMWMYVDNMKRK